MSAPFLLSIPLSSLSSLRATLISLISDKKEELEEQILKENPDADRATIEKLVAERFKEAVKEAKESMGIRAGSTVGARCGLLNQTD